LRPLAADVPDEWRTKTEPKRRCHLHLGDLGPFGTVKLPASRGIVGGLPVVLSQRPTNRLSALNISDQYVSIALDTFASSPPQYL
jgi:hypothetical protein